jgi:hypothetical protein
VALAELSDVGVTNSRLGNEIIKYIDKFGGDSGAEAIEVDRAWVQRFSTKGSLELTAWYDQMIDELSQVLIVHVWYIGSRGITCSKGEKSTPERF